MAKTEIIYLIIREEKNENPIILLTIQGAENISKSTALFGSFVDFIMELVEGGYSYEIKHDLSTPDWKNIGGVCR